MDLTKYVMATFVIIGLINGIGFAIDKEWKSFAFFLTALIAGTLFGFLHWFGLTSAEIGLAVGVGSSGAYKLTQNLGTK